MGLKTEKREIEGMLITSTQLDVMRQLSLLAQLGKVFAPAIGKLKGVTPESDIGVLAPILGELFIQLDPETAESLARDMLACTTAVVDGKIIELDRKEMINHAFAGRLRAMLGALKFSFEVNFADFFAAPGTASAAAPAPAKS